MKSVGLGALGGFLLMLPTLAAQPGFHAQFVGGTIPGIEATSNARLDLAGSDVLMLRSGAVEFHIDYAKINSLEYGQNVSRRYLAAVLISPVLLLSKSRKHFLTIGYSGEDGKQQAMVFRVDKSGIRPMLAGLEARTGLRVQYQDEQARKARNQ
jgi:hypothetical protein